MILLKNTRLNFHIDKRKFLFIIILFSLVSFLLFLFMALSLNDDFAQLKALCHSDYTYSAAIKQPVGKDDYYQFSADISFTLSPDANIRLNADVLMQSDFSEYTDMVYWNANKLSTFGVAISKNIAVANNLDIGDKLYSTHTVSGNICEYFVEQILPEVLRTRNAVQNDYKTGVIIMGYDSQYVDNISYSVITYTNVPVEELSERQTATLEDILYRDDEIVSVCKTFLPYVVIFALLLVLNTIGLVFFLTKSISRNFKRLIVLGFSNKRLDKAYNYLVCGSGCISILIVYMISATVLYSTVILQISMPFVTLLSIVKVVALLVAAAVFKSHLWRN